MICSWYQTTYPLNTSSSAIFAPVLLRFLLLSLFCSPVRSAIEGEMKEPISRSILGQSFKRYPTSKLGILEIHSSCRTLITWG